MQKTFTKEHTNIAKGFAIILLLMYHLFENEYVTVAMGVNYAPLNWETFHKICGFGNVCVSIFVFLTAYGISKGIFKQKELGIKEAYGQARKRFGKLMLNFVILYISVNVFMSPYFNLKLLYGGGWQGMLQLVTDALGMHMFFGTTTMNISWWYMEVAYILIFLVPIMAFMTKKLGNSMLLIMYFLPFAINFNFDVERYLLVATVGICAAKGDWIDKVMNWKVHLVWKWLIGIAGLVFCVLLRQNFLVQERYLAEADALVSLFIVCMTTVVIGSVPGMRKAFAYIGRHSMNIYLVHTFFYMSIWQKETYQFKYAILILLVLLAVTLLYSIVLEGLKKLGKFLYCKIKEKIVAKKNA